MHRIGRRALLLAATAALAASCPAVAADNPDAPERAADSGEKLVCKRFTETGSLFKTYRACKPKRDWQRERDNIRAPSSTSGSCSSAESGSCGGA